jgi:C1A family cysteine protease
MGWHPDRPDPRDHAYEAPKAILAALPRKVDLRPDCPPVYDQGKLDSCTANAIAAAIEYEFARHKSPERFTPARLFIYYNERELEGKVAYDAGARLRDGIKTVAKQGAPPETVWPYEEERFAKQPPRAIYEQASRHRAVAYERLDQDLDPLRACLASGYPFLFGFSVYPSFACKRCDRTGAMPMPRPGESALGGHAALAVGYDEGRRRFIVRNSWGASWGKSGYFTAPYDFVADAGHARDFWTIRLVD